MCAAQKLECSTYRLAIVASSTQVANDNVRSSAPANDNVFIDQDRASSHKSITLLKLVSSPSRASERSGVEPASGVRRGHPQDASPRTDTGRGLPKYDWLGNNEKTGDDANGFYDRSLGETVGDDGANKPYQMKSASLGGARGGSLEAKYDAAGNMIAMSLLRDGGCLGGDCNQKFVYEWDEVGRLVRARRWDGDHSGVNAAATGTLAADLRHYYDASDQRVIKEAVDGAGETSYTLYVFASMELRRTQFGAGFADGPDTLAEDFEVSSETVVAYLMANGVRLARLVYHGDDTVPEEGVLTTGGAGEVNASTSKLHVFFELGDHLGSTSVVLDKATGELVERATFQAYGGAESDYRPDRWKNFREDYRFTGKEEDVEVGLQYFGKRFLNPLLGRWVSADPLAVHAPGSADLNLYAYVSGSVLKNIGLLTKVYG